MNPGTVCEGSSKKHVTLTTRRAKSQNCNNDVQNPESGKPQRCLCNCACCESHPRKLCKLTNTNHGNCEHDKRDAAMRPSTQTHAALGHLKAPTKTNHRHTWGGNSVLRKMRNAVLQTRLQTNINARNQTHSAATLFSARSSATSSATHTSSSRFSHLSPPPQDFQTWQDTTPIKIIGNPHLLVGLANFVNEVMADAGRVHVSCLLTDDRGETEAASWLLPSHKITWTRLHEVRADARGLNENLNTDADNIKHNMKTPNLRNNGHHHKQSTRQLKILLPKPNKPCAHRQTQTTNGKSWDNICATNN